MPSLQAKLFNWYYRRRVKPHPLHLIEPAILRVNMDTLAPKRIPNTIEVEKIDHGPVKGEWHRSKNTRSRRTILYLHGGGYAFGSVKSHRNLTFALAKEAAADVFSLEYRLTPEHPFPAPVEDACAAWNWLIKDGRDPAQITIAGDSAGGGLALALALSCRDRGLPSPAGVVLFSPWTDMSVSGASVDANEETDVMFKRAYIEGGAKNYLAGADQEDPLASPVFADLSGLPPALIFASDSEALLDDAVRVHEKLLSAGGQSKLVVEKGLAHIWPVYIGRFPEAMRTTKQASAFIKAQTNEVG